MADYLSVSLPKEVVLILRKLNKEIGLNMSAYVAQATIKKLKKEKLIKENKDEKKTK